MFVKLFIKKEVKIVSNLHERIAKVKDCCNILHEKFNQKFDKKTIKKKQNCMLYRRCKGCFQACVEHNWCSSCGFQYEDKIKKQIVFKISDYDLRIDERKAKYENYEFILCGKCKSQFSNYCKYCYKEATNEERNRMLYGQYGRCKRCFQACTE